VYAWPPPFNLSGVIAEAAAHLRRFHCGEVVGDRYSVGFVAEGVRGHGLAYVPSTRDRSALYLELVPLINSQRVALLDQAELLRQLRGLERRRGASGRDHVDHQRGAGAHRHRQCVRGRARRGAGRGERDGGRHALRGRARGR
jgi:hypothetical protein